MECYKWDSCNEASTPSLATSTWYLCRCAAANSRAVTRVFEVIRALEKLSATSPQRHEERPLRRASNRHSNSRSRGSQWIMGKVIFFIRRTYEPYHSPGCQGRRPHAHMHRARVTALPTEHKNMEHVEHREIGMWPHERGSRHLLYTVYLPCTKPTSRLHTTGRASRTS